MNIVIVGPAFPYRGGIAHASTLLASHLRKRHTVHMVTFTRQYPGFLFPGTSQEEAASQSHDASYDTLPVRWIDSINPLNWITAGRRIAAMKPDLLIFRYWLPFFGPCFGTVARVVRRAGRTKVLYLCDNIIPHERRPGDKPFTRYAFGAGDSFLVQSDTVEQQLLDLLPGANYEKIPHPVYELFGAVTPRTEARTKLQLSTRNVVLFFGYIRKYKGLMTLIEAFARYLNDVKDSPTLADTTLMVVGEFYDDEARYRNRAAELGLGDRIRFVAEYVPTDAVSGYFSASNVVVLPYLSATQSGIVQIAYNFGTPVITTDVGGLGEVVRDGVTGFVVPPDNPQQVAAALQRFFSGNHEEGFSANIEIERKKYSWEAMAEAVERLASV